METKLAFETLFVFQSLDDTQVQAATQVLSYAGTELDRFAATHVLSKTGTRSYTGTQLDRYAATQVLSKTGSHIYTGTQLPTSRSTHGRADKRMRPSATR